MQEYFQPARFARPFIDQGLAALLNDLELRGQLDSTLVVLTTELRTPRINVMAGRDHYPRRFRSCWQAVD